MSKIDKKKKVAFPHMGLIYVAWSAALRKVGLEPGQAILVEVKTGTTDKEPSYNHRVYEIDSDVDLTRPFEFTKTYHVNEELKTLEKAKQYIKKPKRGNK